MDLLSETQSGCVKIKHHSTSSTVEVIILSTEEKTQGGEKEETILLEVKSTRSATEASKIKNISDAFYQT